MASLTQKYREDIDANECVFAGYDSVPRPLLLRSYRKERLGWCWKMAGGSSAELEVIGHASIGTDEETASTRAAWSQGNRWVGIGVAVRPIIVRDDSAFKRNLSTWSDGSYQSYDSGYASDPTRPQSTKFDVEEPVANRAVDIPRSSCQDGAAKASTQVGYFKVGSELFLTEVRIFIGK